MRELIGKERVLLRAARGSGKTKAALKWATHQENKRIVFVSSSEAASTMVYRTAEMLYAETGDLADCQERRRQLFFRNGTSIHFVSKDSSIGLRSDCVVLDDVDRMDDMEVCYAMATASHNGHISFFATHSSTYGSGLTRICKMDRVEPITVYTYDYLDMLAEGRMSADFVRYLAESLHKNSFLQEYGPYEKALPRKSLTNKLPKHLLIKDA